MTSRFIGKPPQRVDRRSLLRHILRSVIGLSYIVWQIVAPFKSRPEEIDPLPEPIAEISTEQVQQSQWMFDQAEERRVHLEQKAQSTFGLMTFLVPLLASLFVFISGKLVSSGVASRTLFTGLLVVSGVFLLLGFISAVRAVSVKGYEGLFLQAVIDEEGQFRKYDKAFHARGLLYCAAMNHAINDHLAQFVKGAHLLTAAAVVGMIVAAVPVNLVLSNPPSSPSEIKVTGPVDVSFPELRTVGADVTNLKQDIRTLLSTRQADIDHLREIESKVASLEAKLSQLQKTAPTGMGKNNAGH
jgi:hypothetical protein